MKIKVNAPAKINLGLEILSKRTDGMHDLDMIMQSVDLFDEIEIEKTSESIGVVVKHEKKVSHEPNQDIAYKCAKLFLEKVNALNDSVLININKNIPMAAGLAGGSSDGAAVLVGLNHIYGDPLSKEDLMQIGGQVGSDIPFCIMGGTARATGTGTTLRKIKTFSDYFLVLVKPEISIFTAEAYKLSDSIEKSEIINFDSLEKAIKSSNLQEIPKFLFNRFEGLINKEIIRKIKEGFISLGASAALMSGSGPSVYGVFDFKSIALNSFNEMKKNYKEVFLCRPINYGAKIIN